MSFAKYLIFILVVTVASCAVGNNLLEVQNEYNRNKFKVFEIDRVKLKSTIDSFANTYLIAAPLTFEKIEPILNDIEVTIKSKDNLKFAILLANDYRVISYREIK
jgi:hypothetical protein